MLSSAYTDRDAWEFSLPLVVARFHLICLCVSGD